MKNSFIDLRSVFAACPAHLSHGWKQSLKLLLLLFLMLCTHKSHAQVNQEWVSRYNGTDNKNDGATSMVIDGSGNVYVTGSRNSIATSDDYCTIKYNSLGVQKWVAVYNGPGNGSDAANSIAVDASGNVYVTGGSPGSGTGRDIATIKYNSSGAQVWAVRYNGPANNHDGGTSIAVDAAGNVYVTGSCTGSGAPGPGYDYITIKYDSQGTQLWAVRYNGPGNNIDIANSMAIDISGNVYVTGYSYETPTNGDYATIKYNSNGIQQWVQRYNGLGNADDQSYSIVLDGSGNVFVTGFSAGSGTGNDYATIKYDNNGVQRWIQRYNGTGNGSDIAWSLAADVSGNVYVTGQSTGILTGFDYAVIKYDNNGVQQWVSRYDGPVNGDDVSGWTSHVIAVDNSGNVYVTGQSPGIKSGTDYTTIKYNSSGEQLWIQRYNGSRDSVDNAYSIALDGSGNVYVTGQSTSTGTRYDFATIKYSQNYSVSGVVKYKDNSQLVTRGYVKAVKYDILSGKVITVDSTQVGSNGRYTLSHVPQDSLDIMVYQNDEDIPTIVPTYYISTIDWHQAKTIYPVSDIDTINIFAFRVQNGANPFSINGSVFDRNSGGLTDAIIYAKIGDSFMNFAFSNSAGTYNVDNLPPGNYELILNRMGYTNAVNLVAITTSSLNSVNFYVAHAPQSNNIPGGYKLYQNHPNPFNPLTTIDFDITAKDNGLSDVNLILYDVLGREIEIILDKKLESGSYEITWNGSNFSSGIYFCKLKADNYTETKKIVLLK